MTNEDKIYELIVKNLSGEISEEEKQVLEQHLSENQSQRNFFLTLRTFWKSYFPKQKQHSIISKTEKKLCFTYRLNTKTNSFGWLQIAATLLLIVSLSYSVFHIVKPPQKLTLKEYGCGPSEVKEFVLSDGTKVWLNSSSLLIANEPFIGATREVKLFGEAYFEVAHNEKQPFEVQTRNLKTRVLGTHFNVLAYPTDKVHEIALYQGKVEINSKLKTDKSIILNAGDRAYFSPETGKINVTHTNIENEALWRDGILRFYNEEFFSITRKLERKFHTKIFIADSIVGNLKFSAEFEEESLKKIMQILYEAHEFEYEFTSNGIFIR